MKFLFFFTAVSLFAVNICDENYSNIATAQLASITKLLNSINNLQANVQSQLAFVYDTLFNFDSDPRVKALGDYINKNMEVKGVANCKTMYDNALASLNQQLQSKAWEQMNILLNHLHNFTNVLECIQKELSDTGFDRNVKACESSKDKCQITGSFAENIKNIQNNIVFRSSSVGTNGLAKKIMNQMSAEEKFTLISNTVLNPVTLCLQHRSFTTNA